jgi:uncharacterized membrane protein
MKRKYWLLAAAILMILIGILRGSGGMALLIRGRQLETTVPIIASGGALIIVAIGLLIIALLLILAGINLMKNKSTTSWDLSWIVLIFFFLDGLLNGFLLFGQPIDQGQRINIIAVLLIGILLFLGKPGLKLKE